MAVVDKTEGYIITLTVKEAEALTLVIGATSHNDREALGCTYSEASSLQNLYNNLPKRKG